MQNAPYQKQPSADSTQFAVIPMPDVPRSTFRQEHTHKTTFSGGYLVPIFVDEVLPGDSFNVKMTSFVRMATPLYPIMDNLDLETFFFFVPNRLLWDNWRKFMGQQDSPGDSIAFTVPQIVSAAGGFPRHSVADYFGLPCTPNAGANTISVNAMPFRAYRFIYHEWFRDQNLITLAAHSRSDGPDAIASYALQKRAKAHDYFTSALPWAQKGTSPPLLVTGNALVKTSTTETFTGIQTSMKVRDASTGAQPVTGYLAGVGAANAFDRHVGVATFSASGAGLYPTNLYADLATATANTINQLRTSFAIQKFLERDARGGTRYTEMIRAHFGVNSPDGRLQRPEYLGGGKSPIQIAPVVQASQTGLTGGTTPLGHLGGLGASVQNIHGFQQAFTEHGFVIGIANVRADVTYQQGIRRHWSRSTRYDYYHPVFQALGEQAILNKEIYADGSANDLLTFGFQERWAEYRHHPSRISGSYNSTFTTPLDAWHLAQKFTVLPTLNQTFIEDGTEAVLSRALAIGGAANNQQFIGDFYFDAAVTRAMPTYSVPGMLDRF